MKINNSFKNFNIYLETFQIEETILAFTQTLSAEHFPTIKTQAKLKAILEKSTFQISKMVIFKSNGTFCNFYPTLPKTFFILKMGNQTNFNSPKWKLSSKMDSDTYVKIITRKLIKKSELRNSEFLMKLKFPSSVTRKF